MFQLARQGTLRHVGCQTICQSAFQLNLKFGGSGRRSFTPTDLSLSAQRWAAIRVELSLTARFYTAIMPQTDRQMTYKHKYINTHMRTHLCCSHIAKNDLHCTRFVKTDYMQSGFVNQIPEK